ncbi:hypothetical protein HDV02_006402, partial [Globomyces sp. JEL0801]
MPKYIQNVLSKSTKKFYSKKKYKEPQKPKNRRQTPYADPKSAGARRHYQRILIRVFHYFDWICRVHPEFQYILLGTITLIKLVDKPNHCPVTFGTKEEYSKNLHVQQLLNLLKNDRGATVSTNDTTQNNDYSDRYKNVPDYSTVVESVNIMLKLNHKVMRAVAARWREHTLIEFNANPPRETCVNVVRSVLINIRIPTQKLWDSLIGIDQCKSVSTENVCTLMKVLDCRCLALREEDLLPDIALDGETNCRLRYNAA